WRLFFVFLFITPIWCRAQLGFSLTNGERRVRFPIEITNNLVIIPVVLNGQLPLKFILDTGVRTTILTEKSFSDILKLTYGRHLLVAGPGGEKIVEAYITNDVTLDMPGVHGEGHAMLVLEKDYLELRNYLGTDVQGVLGYEVFSRFVVEVDYEKKMLTLSVPDAFKPKSSFQVLPMTVEDTKPYVHVPVEMNNGNIIDAKLLIDTGASHGLVLDPATNDKIVLPEKHVPSLIGRGIGGLITGQIGRINSIKMGKYKIQGIVANFPDSNSYMDTLKTTDVFRNGVIGGELLSRFTVIYNFAGEKIYFKKNSTFARKFHFNMSGITLKAKGARLRRFEVTDVRANSAAEKVGIQPGDELLSINGLPVSDLDLNSINAFFNSKPGKKVRVDILRGTQRIHTTFTLESPI
ncbi:MAG TPA: aspartyl protease family protein, partial [Cyclobacteriaceae bacterium]|nr:aspartyl protease family protein [Cyclobacteriaceae bacterium]